MSDDGRFAIVVIALLGNPFSPAYAAARARGEQSGKQISALDYSSMHVALYGPDRSLWALTELPIKQADRSRDGVRIGRSFMREDGANQMGLRVTLDEKCAPFGRALRGEVRLIAESDPRVSLPIDAKAAHTWWPVAPLARIEVALEEPNVRFSGHGYHDANAGAEPLPDAFRRWTWSRARVRDAAIVTYDTELVDGETHGRALEFTRDGRVREVEDIATHPLPTTGWRLPRHGRGDELRIERSLSDTPFYARALVSGTLRGERVVAMHEELSCTRLASPWVRLLLGFRMRREKS